MNADDDPAVIIDHTSLHWAGQLALLEKMRRAKLSIRPHEDAQDLWLGLIGDEVMFDHITPSELIKWVNSYLLEIEIMDYNTHKHTVREPVREPVRPQISQTERTADDYKDEHLTVTIVCSTPKAHRVRFNGAEAWLPRSKIKKMQGSGDNFDITIPFWLFKANFGE